MPIAIYKVDAFTDRAFAGNPAAVCVLDGPAEEAWMQSVAAEMNVSETAFIHEDRGVYQLRWFTPTVEVDLCGHATLASAHILWEQGLLDEDRTAVFETRSGRLSATREKSRVQLDFPAEPAAVVTPPDEFLDALGAHALFVGCNRMDYLVEVESQDALCDLKPDFARLSPMTRRGVIVTAVAEADTGFDFVSRFFAPAAGVDEDPVTGSAHCCLGPYWQARLSRNSFTAFQASARGGVVGVTVAGDRVLLVGDAVTVLVGHLMV